MNLTLITTTDCNCSCEYCRVAGYRHGDEMPIEIGLRALALAARDIESYGLPNFIYLSLTGGEPLLAWRGLTAWIERASVSFARPLIYVTTNGFGLDEEKLTFLREHGVRVCLSIDGDRDVYLQHRRIHGSEYSFETVLDKARLLLGQMPYARVRMTVTPRTVSRLPESFEFVRQLGFSYIRLSPDELNSRWNDDAIRQYREGLAWIQQRIRQLETMDVPRVHFPILHSRRRVMLRTMEHRKRRLQCGFMGHQVLPDGRVYPCPLLVSRREFDMGHILQMDSLVDARRTLKCLEPYCNEIPPGCRDCEHVCYCENVKCLAKHFVTTGNFLTPADSLCALEKANLEVVKEGLDGHHDHGRIRATEALFG